MTSNIRTAVRNADLLSMTRTGGMVAAAAAVGFATAACGADDSAATEPAAQSGAASTEATGGGGTYRDGNYTATGHYTSPGGPQQIGVTVTLANSQITKVSLDRSHTTGTSAEFQAKFASGIDAEVVGKNIDELDVSKVSGSSLTSGGFNDAIDQIKAQAQG
ncbi:MAG: FMN-binding protein [Gordonia sp. (in: high G+C Gram-positive bacteria)]